MLLPVKQNKRALSVVIGYILLIAISIAMSVVVYQWLRTYVPKEAIKCPEGTSVFIKDIYYDCTNSVLNITVKNNGKFSINGYFIHVSNKSGEEIPTIDISKNIVDGGVLSGSSITFSDTVKNALTPDEPTNTKKSSFNVENYKQLYKLEIIPTRIQDVEDKERLVSCADAKIEATLACNA
jgi:FlaG/FlaF family flagellin (archaellin)